MDIDKIGVKLKEVYIKNFRGYGENESREDKYFAFLGLDNDFVLLNGFNGYGKTSFFEAIEWCLTDSVERLSKFKDFYNSSMLKKSFYLKFFSVKDKKAKRNKREIDVKLVFNNGLIIRRTSKCNFLKVTPKDTYLSNFQATLNNIELSENSSEVVSKLILNKNMQEISKDGILNTNFLGQESINNFIRAKRPEERKKTLMKLLNLEDIYSIKEKSEVISNSKAIMNKISNNNKSIETVAEYRRKLDERFLNSNWGTIENYISLLNTELDNYLKLCTNSEYSDLIELHTDYINIPFSIINCINKLKTFKLLNNSLKNRMEKIHNDKLRIIEIENIINKVDLCNKFIEYENVFIQLSFLKQININEIDTNIVKVKTEKETIEKDLIKLNDDMSNIKNSYLNNETNINKIFVDEFGNNIDFKEYTIKEKFWTEYKDFWFKTTKLLESLEDKINLKKEISDIKNELLNTTSIESCERTYKELSNEVNVVLSELNEKQKMYSIIKNSNDNYNKVLIMVKDYVIDNKNTLEECPICHNNDFTSSRLKKIFTEYDEKETNNESLISIIDLTISSGDKTCEKVINDITIASSKKASINNKIQKEVIQKLEREFTLLFSKVEEILSEILNNIKIKVRDLNQELKSHNEVIKDNLDKQSRYKECINNISKYIDVKENVNISMELVSESITRFKKEKQNITKKIVNELQFPYTPKFDEIVNKRDYLFNQLNENDKNYLNNADELKKNKSKLNITINFHNKILENLEKIISYDLPEEYDEIFKEISQNEIKVQSIKNETIKLERYVKNSEKIFANAKEIEETILRNLSEKNTIISWIYNHINPHPYYRDVMIDLDKDGGVIFKSKSNDVIYGQIFSSAQLNILALSIFLGLGIPQSYSKLEQLFLDDPIQSMDDTNILALIDVFRGIIDSECGRSLVISSHDDDFSKLVAIKMRNREITHYNFVGYSEEGPIIEQVV